MHAAKYYPSSLQSKTAHFKSLAASLRESCFDNNQSNTFAGNDGGCRMRIREAHLFTQV
jgi:hypothetical protein